MCAMCHAPGTRSDELSSCSQCPIAMHSQCWTAGHMHATQSHVKLEHAQQQVEAFICPRHFCQVCLIRADRTPERQLRSCMTCCRSFCALHTEKLLNIHATLNEAWRLLTPTVQRRLHQLTSISSDSESVIAGVCKTCVRKDVSHAQRVQLCDLFNRQALFYAQSLATSGKQEDRRHAVVIDQAWLDARKARATQSSAPQREYKTTFEQRERTRLWKLKQKQKALDQAAEAAHKKQAAEESKRANEEEMNESTDMPPLEHHSGSKTERRSDSPVASSKALTAPDKAPAASTSHKSHPPAEPVSPSKTQVKHRASESKAVRSSKAIAAERLTATVQAPKARPAPVNARTQQPERQPRPDQDTESRPEAAPAHNTTRAGSKHSSRSATNQSSASATPNLSRHRLSAVDRMTANAIEESEERNSIIRDEKRQARQKAEQREITKAICRSKVDEPIECNSHSAVKTRSSYAQHQLDPHDVAQRLQLEATTDENDEEHASQAIADCIAAIRFNERDMASWRRLNQLCKTAEALQQALSIQA